MAAIKKSVRLVDNTIDVCRVISITSKQQGNESVNWSGSINAMADGYQLIMSENKPELTDNQWNALYASITVIFHQKMLSMKLGC